MAPLSLMNDYANCEADHSYGSLLNTEPLTVSSSKNKKSVSFLGRVLVKPSLHVQDFTPQEISACWYDQKEFKLMRKDIRDAAEFFESGMAHHDTDEVCRRGLEAADGQLTRLRLRRRNRVYDAIFDEQDAHWRLGMMDPESIAHVARKISRQSALSAQAMGMKDHFDAVMM